MARRFEVGDRVVASVNYEILKAGDNVTIIAANDYGMMTIEFDEDRDGAHGGGSIGRRNRCWNINEEVILKADEYPLITIDTKPGTRVRLAYDAPFADEYLRSGHCGYVVARPMYRGDEFVPYLVVDFDEELDEHISKVDELDQHGNTIHVREGHCQLIAPHYLEPEIEVRRIIWGENDTQTITFN